MSREIREQTSLKTLPIALDVNTMGMTDEQFYKLCRANKELKLELTAQGELIIIAPTGSLTGWRNAKITHYLTAWSEKTANGLTFDSSTGFVLPNGAKRSPDASWVRQERWDCLSEEEKEGFAPICPDFVVELRSADDVLSKLQEKMLEYIENGAKLGWLFDPKNKNVYIYQPNQPEECLQNPETISADPILPGFTLKLKNIW
ncbi:MAG: Uma2 family endonuclease [Acidobacteria bacterium]|nr:Uma2 family endonuclease [Acidobacteriota bacterium]